MLMLKAICTLRNDDGSYDEAGMTNRTIIAARNLDEAHQLARRGHRPYRLEVFDSHGFYGMPLQVDYCE